ncbi:MAG: methyltransferase domain-containing protein [Saprospiraceae bacterium]
MASPQNLHDRIKTDYASIVVRNEETGGETQRATVCGPIHDPIAGRYATFAGYREASDLGLGCAFPFTYAGIEKGDAVADLGCAAGVDSFIVREMVGETGMVHGFDLTPALVERGQRIATANGMTNIQFREADITALPLDDESVDAAISNGVFSLLPNPGAGFREAFRILRSGGTFALADINRRVDYSPADYATILELTGCLNGIRRHRAYLELAAEAGFTRIEVAEERPVVFAPGQISEHPADGVFISVYRLVKG